MAKLAKIDVTLPVLTALDDLARDNSNIFVAEGISAIAEEIRNSQRKFEFEVVWDRKSPTRGRPNKVDWGKVDLWAESASKMARKYGVSEQTIVYQRKRARKGQK